MIFHFLEGTRKQGFHVFLLKLEKTVLNKTTTLLLRIVTFNVPDPPF